MRIAQEVAAALQNGAPIVALETAVITCGLPRSPWPEAWGTPPASLGSGPINGGAAVAVADAVRALGAVPAWTAIVGGDLRIGLDDDEIADLAADPGAAKASPATAAISMATGRSAGTTVGGALAACAALTAAGSGTISVMATGGIGGVHRNWVQHPDLSGDLPLLARTPMCVVCSGAKTILDLPATREALETLGIPIVGVGCDRFPRFVEASGDEDPAIENVETPEAVAEICQSHFGHLHRPGAVLAAVAVPADVALPRGSVERAGADPGGGGGDRTPEALDGLATATDGRSLVANLALLAQNAAVAAHVAVAIGTSRGS